MHFPRFHIHSICIFSAPVEIDFICSRLKIDFKRLGATDHNRNAVIHAGLLTLGRMDDIIADLVDVGPRTGLVDGRRDLFEVQVSTSLETS